MNYSLIGSWKLVKGYVVSDGIKNEYSSDTMKAMKTLSKNNICFVSINNDAFYAAGSGYYIIDNDYYIETIENASWTLDKNLQFKFKYKILDNIWENWKYDNEEIVEYEKWERISE